ncbi:hypothetical protein BU15DRAFT_48468 [Melanogaster broomeanus]|nr:hypothetical protein BU15DRAFT_48468 [Melanogaster broomeanus]
MAPIDPSYSEDVSEGDRVLRPNLSDVTPLDPNLYSLSAEAAEFFKATTRIDNDGQLKAHWHILMVQEKAYKVAPYPCIYGFGFLTPKIAQNSAYRDIIKLGRERQGSILLDIGSCLSVDARKAAVDGFPACNIVASDIKKEYSELSHLLFRTSKDSYPGHYVVGDVFDWTGITIIPPVQEILPSRPDLSNLTSLNPLHGHCSVINASAFFHLFDEERQLHMARALAGLLSPEPGSIICGVHVGAPEKEIVTGCISGRHYSVFCHSTDSWAELWDGAVFGKGQVKVEVEIRVREFLDIKDRSMFWSVKRL